MRLNRAAMYQVAVIVAAVISVLVIIWATTYLYGVIGEANRQSVLAQKRACVDNGGRVTEYHTWFEGWACDRFERVK